jgi:hypothetical protein
LFRIVDRDYEIRDCSEGIAEQVNRVWYSQSVIIIYKIVKKRIKGHHICVQTVDCAQDHLEIKSWDFLNLKCLENIW